MVGGKGCSKLSGGEELNLVAIQAIQLLLVAVELLLVAVELVYQLFSARRGLESNGIHLELVIRGRRKGVMASGRLWACSKGAVTRSPSARHF